METTVSEQRNIEIARDAIGNTLITGDSNVVVIQATRTLAEEKPEPTAIGPNPYRGLSAFDENDADCFFGREALTEKLWDLFRRLHEPPPGEYPVRLLPILGPSGSGKSSLARAGLIPELARRPFQGLREPQVAVLTPGAQPIESLAAVLARIATADPSPVAKTREFADELRHRNTDGEYDGLRRVADALPNITTSQLVVLVDQFEETYSLCEDDEEQNAFVGNLLRAASDRGARVSVILTFRSDFLGATAHHPELNRLVADEGVIVPAMDEEDLRRAIAEPAKRAGHEIDEATVDLLVAETQGREGALPLLQFVLTRVWEGIGEGATPAETIRRLNGIGGALAEAAERLCSGLDERDKDVARRAFLAMVRLGEGTRDTRRRAKLSEIVAEGENREHVLDVIRTFARPSERLVTLLADDSGAVTAEVTHESLFDHWHRLSEWLTSSREDIRFHRRLAENADRWERQGRPIGLLWRPPDLDRLRDFAKRARGDMTALQAEFFRNSDQRQIRERRVKQGAVAVIGVLAIAAVGAAVWAELQREEAEVQRKEAIFQQTVAEDAFERALRTQSLFLADLSRQQAARDQTTTAALLALEALPKSADDPRPYVPEAEAALYHALLAHRQEAILEGHEAEVLHVSYSPDGSRIVTTSKDGTARLWDPRSRAEVALLGGHDGQVFFAAFGPDSKRVVTASEDKTARLWDARSGQEIGTMVGHTDWIWQVAFSPDGARIVTASEDDTARVWDASTGATIVELAGHNGTVFHAAYSNDGGRIVTASSDNTARLWDAETGSLLATLEGHSGTVHRALFDPSGDYVLTASADGTARLWDAETGRQLKALEGHSDKVVDAAFSPGGRFVATASYDHLVAFWDLAEIPEVGASGNSGEWLWDTSIGDRAYLIGHSDWVQRVAFSPDGRHIVTTSNDGTARLWDTLQLSRLAVLRDHENWVSDAAFAPDGRQLATASSDRTARLWDATAGGQVLVFAAHDDKINDVALAPDGIHLITASNDKTARVWNLGDGSLVATLGSHDGMVSRGVFGPGTKRALTSSIDGTARIWDVATGAEVLVLNGHDEWVKDAAFDADGGRLVTASKDKTARIWDATSGEEIAVLRGHDKAVGRAEFDEAGERIVTASDDGTARVWDAKSGAQLAVLTGHNDKVVTASFSTDGSRIVTASNDNTARVWNAGNGEPIHVLEGHDDWVRDAHFNHDGSRIVTASNDNTARLWNPETGAEEFVLSGHREWVRDAEFSSDGRRVVTASSDMTARLWDADTGTEIGILEGHSAALVKATFSADGRHVISASRDGTARLYWVPPPLAELVDTATELVPRVLTAEERRRFFIDVGGDGTR